MGPVVCTHVASSQTFHHCFTNRLGRSGDTVCVEAGNKECVWSSCATE